MNNVKQEALSQQPKPEVKLPELSEQDRQFIERHGLAAEDLIDVKTAA